jgi:phospholipid/cholesterol/gamma-HCH transport system substrate-binding protein
METLKWRDLKTGLLFVCGLAVAAWLGFYIGKNTGLLSQHRYVKLFVTDVKGVTEGNLVSISGKKVGVVKSEEFTSRNDSNGVLLTLDLRDEFFPLLTQDSRATIKSLGVLGDKYVDIAIGHVHERLKDGAYLTLASEPGLEDLTASAISTMKNVNELTAKINNGEGSLGKLITTNDLNDRLTTITGNLAVLSDQLTHGTGMAAQIVNNGQLAQDIGRTMKNLNDLSTRLNGDGAVGKMVLGEGLLAKLNGISDRADTLIRSLTLASNGLSTYANAADGQFYGNVNKSVLAMHGAISSLDSLLTDLKKNPKRYINVSVF